MNAVNELWQNKKVRTGAVLGVIGLGVIFIGVSMTDEEEIKAVTEKNPAPVEGSFFGFSGPLQDITSEEASDMVDKVAHDFEQREKARQATEQEMRRQNQELASRVAEQDRRFNEMMLQMQALAKGQGSVQPRQPGTATPAGRTGQQTQPTAQEQTYALGNQNQSQIITRGTSATSPIIRTVTQRNITTLMHGEITQQNVEINTINGRNGAERVEPVVPEFREPLLKVEEEGTELFTLSMGSIISGTLLNGVAAPTSNDRKSDPMPVLMRIKREAIMPNGFSLDIVDCHMLGSAIGQLSSSRVLIRAEAISCNTHTGEAIEQRIMAYAVDSADGLAGVEGEVIFKSGAMIANSLKAEFISGFADAFSPNQVQALNTNPSATTLWQDQNLDRAAGAGIGRGFSGAADRIADYYMTLAEEAHPVIELLPGMEVDFIVQRGMTLRLGGREAPYINNRMGARDQQSLSVSGPDAQVPAVTVNL